MVTQVQIEEEVHIACIRKQTEFRVKGLKKPSITSLVNKATLIGIKDVPVEGVKENTEVKEE